MKTKKCGIYKIVNRVNGKIYIGQSVDIEKRWKEHISYSKRNNNRPLYCSIRKYGLDNFLFEVIVECDEHVLDEFEIGIIKLYDTTNSAKGYNLTFGGSNGRLSNETKQKISDAHKGKPKSDEHKKKISEALNGKKGKPKSDEHKKNISNAKKNMTNVTKAKISESTKKQYLYQGIIYNGKQELADFLGITYKSLTDKIFRKRIDVTIIPKKSIE